MRSRNSFMKFGRKHDGGVARDFAVGGAERLNKRAMQRCVRDYRRCHCRYFLIIL